MFTSWTCCSIKRIASLNVASLKAKIESDRELIRVLIIPDSFLEVDRVE